MKMVRMMILLDETDEGAVQRLIDQIKEAYDPKQDRGFKLTIGAVNVEEDWKPTTK